MLTHRALKKMDYGDRQDRAEIIVKLFRERANTKPYPKSNHTYGQMADEIENMTELGREVVAVAGFVFQAFGSTPEFFSKKDAS